MAPVAMSMGDWFFSNIRSAGLFSGITTAAIVLLIAYSFDRLIGARRKVLAVFAFLAVPLIVVPSWRPDYPGGFDNTTVRALQGQHLPGLSALIYSDGSSWKWSRELGAHLSMERFHTVPESLGLRDRRFASFIYEAARHDRGSDPWIPITRSGPRIDDSRSVYVQMFPVLVDDGPFAGRALQEMYQFTGRERSSLFLISRSPSWQYRLGSKVSRGFATWLTSIDALQTLEEGYWMAIILFALLMAWSVRRTMASIRVANELRLPGDRRPFSGDVFVLFALGTQDGSDFVLQILERFERRSQFCLRQARLEYYWIALSALHLVLPKVEKTLLALWRRRTAEILSRL